MSDRLITRVDLDQMGCDLPNCSHDHSILHLHPQCHVGFGTHVSYHKVSGTLRLVCARCKQFICEIIVASGPPR